MSYDASLIIYTGNSWHEVVDIGDYNYNVSPMFSLAIGESITELSGANARYVDSVLEMAIKKMEDESGFFKELAPTNGWGNYEGALAYLKRIQGYCKDHPLCTFIIT